MRTSLNSEKKFVVVHAGARDHYQVPLALAEGEMLEAFVTDAFKTGGAIGRLVSLLPQYVSRRNALLEKSRVVNSPAAFALSLFEVGATRAGWHSFGAVAQYRKDRALSLRAFNEAVDSGADIFSTSYYAIPAFRKLLERSGRQSLLFQIHPDPKELKKMFEEEIALQPCAAYSLKLEKEMNLDSGRLDELASEPKLAKRVLVASDFTKRTLVNQGIPDDKITVCSYGVDFGTYKVREAVNDVPSDPFRIAFVGSVIQRKGLSYLLEAVSRFPKREVELTFYTRGVIDQPLIKKYAAENIKIVERLSNTQVIERLERSDLFVLPSLAEGFGHSLAEAMAVGVPVLASVNTMANDCIDDRVDGLLVPIRSADAIEERIAWCLSNREELFEIGRRGAAKIRQFSWNRFRNGVRDFARQDQLVE